MKKTDVIIVGAMKAGTSSLAFHMNNHPSISMPLEEVHFFDLESNFNKGYEWYENIFSEYNEDNLIGEKTPTYCYLEKVPQRIYDYNPEVKLIWIFRNPINRAYSNYWHSVKRGNEKLSFEQSVEQEETRIKENVFKGYLQRGIYYKQIKNYLNYFSHEQMHYLLFEKFIKNPLKELEQIFSFLEIPKSDDYQYIEEVRHKTIIPRRPRLLKKIGETFGIDSFIFRVLSSLCYKGKKPGYPELSRHTRKMLKEFFKEPNQKLKELTGLETEIWD